MPTRRKIAGIVAVRSGHPALRPARGQGLLTESGVVALENSPGLLAGLPLRTRGLVRVLRAAELLTRPHAVGAEADKTCTAVNHIAALTNLGGPRVDAAGHAGGRIDDAARLADAARIAKQLARLHGQADGHFDGGPRRLGLHVAKRGACR